MPCLVVFLYCLCAGSPCVVAMHVLGRHAQLTWNSLAPPPAAFTPAPTTPLVLLPPRLGYVAYKHSCPEVCNAIINNMYGYNAMEVQEAFVKIKEQAKAYLDMPGEATAGGGQGRQEQLAAGAAARMQQTQCCQSPGIRCPGCCCETPRVPLRRHCRSVCP
jgi:hypothetical protein